jgi:hypothetical protein
VASVAVVTALIVRHGVRVSHADLLCPAAGNQEAEMTADYELPGPSFGGQCPVCSVWTEAREGGICHTVSARHAACAPIRRRRSDSPA